MKKADDKEKAIWFLTERITLSLVNGRAAEIRTNPKSYSLIFKQLYSDKDFPIFVQFESRILNYDLPKPVDVDDLDLTFCISKDGKHLNKKNFTVALNGFHDFNNSFEDRIIDERLNRKTLIKKNFYKMLDKFDIPDLKDEIEKTVECIYRNNFSGCTSFFEALLILNSNNKLKLDNPFMDAWYEENLLI